MAQKASGLIWQQLCCCTRLGSEECQTRHEAGFLEKIVMFSMQVLNSHPQPTWAPTHPGELLKEEVIPATGLTSTDVAGRIGVSRQKLQAVLACRSSVTPLLALKLGTLLGTTPQSWLAMQRNYDLWHARQVAGDSLAGIERVAATEACLGRP